MRDAAEAAVQACGAAAIRAAQVHAMASAQSDYLHDFDWSVYHVLGSSSLAHVSGGVRSGRAPTQPWPALPSTARVACLPRAQAGTTSSTTRRARGAAAWGTEDRVTSAKCEA